MKDSEFIELLNLYLDHEISPADATRLEAEVLGNPARRQIYQQYCRMQKGCKLLAQDFVAEPAAADRKVIEFAPTASPRRKALYMAGALTAAAASLAVIFVGRNRISPTTAFSVASTPAATPASAIAATMPTDTPAATAAVTRSADLGSVPALKGMLSLGRAPQAAPSLLFAGDRSAQQFEWMKTLRLPPVQRVPAEQLRFESKSPLRSDSRTYDSGHPMEDSVEMTAFRFQR